MSTSPNPNLELQSDNDFRTAMSALESIRTEALRLYRPLPRALPFHLSPASERVVRGGNQSSKTTSCAVEFASELTRTPIHDCDGNELPLKFPERKLLAWVTGYDQNHIGGTIYPKLFMPGAIDLIRDKETGQWRAYNPLDPEDLAREDEIVPAPPLISERMIDPKGWAWEDKPARVFKVCRLKNGNEIRAFSSGGKCPQGAIVDIIWIDEDVQDPRHVNEWRIRQGKCRGRLWWSAWPHSRNDALIRMSERAEEQEEFEDPDITEIVLQFSHNPFIPAKEKRRILDGMTPEERMTRDTGEFMTGLQLVFPSFNVDIHGIPSVRKPDKLEQELEYTGGKVPDDWSHYMVLDPGHAHPAVLFAAVPPPMVGDFVLVYDEVYIPRIDATRLAEEAFKRAGGKQFRAFIMDYRAGRQTALGIGKTYREIYSEAWAAKGLKSYLSGSTFFFGSDNIAARNMQVRGWLNVRPEDGTTKLRVLRDRCPMTIRQFGLYKKRLTRDDISEDVVAKDNDLMDCLGYLAGWNPEYERVDIPVTPRSLAMQARDRIMRDSKPKDDYSIYLGAGAAPVTST